MRLTVHHYGEMGPPKPLLHTKAGHSGCSKQTTATVTSRHKPSQVKQP